MKIFGITISRLSKDSKLNRVRYQHYPMRGCSYVKGDYLVCPWGWSTAFLRLGKNVFSITYPSARPIKRPIKMELPFPFIDITESSPDLYAMPAEELRAKIIREQS